MFAECVVCGMGRSSTIHRPASECHACKGPSDHHDYAVGDLERAITVLLDIAEQVESRDTFPFHPDLVWAIEEVKNCVS